ncbi:MAG: GTP 3',8-cyclase MoaA [Phycisphaerales bacterium]|nr:GTP 3',8-cyclase MoaA [Phycisphaerales bacterium]
MPVHLDIAGQSPPAEAPQEALSGPLRDSHGRAIRDLRLSVTDRCNFRCVYCMAPDVRYIPKLQLLTLEEYVRIVRIAMSLGITKLRITGGEPTLYPHLDDFIEQVGGLGLRDLAMTTNGSRLRTHWAERWKRHGLKRLTISLDTLRPDRKDAITRAQTSLESIIHAVSIAKDAGLDPVKVNAVIIRGVNDDELASFADFALEHGVDMRLIEFMPLDAGGRWERRHVVTADEMIDRLGRTHTLEVQDDPPNSTSINYRIANSDGRIGIIASVSRAFCDGCDRLRIMADGKVRPCLFSDDEWDLKPLLRRGASDADIAGFLRGVVWNKSPGHSMNHDDFKRPSKTMSTIGG